jgi:alkanesulfonate monooxygenase SsuD/methylene tetrahydromethanopterin reductase-like flavin-dependent oxidoreductase (luciferase family)
MANPNITFGYTLQATRATPAADSGQTAAQALQELIEQNEQFIRALKPPFDTVWLEDHLQWGDRPLIECWTTLTYLMAKYPNLKFGSIVMGQSYRPAALTAKMAAVLQAMSGGRLILGLGAGWKEDEYLAYGYDYPAAKVRIEQFDDACAIIKAMFNDSPATYQGKHYHIENAYCEPRPDPMIPLLLGGAGEKLTLRVVAKYADWWNMNFCTAEEMAAKQQVLREHCKAIGRNYDEIKQTYYGFLQVVNDPAEIKPNPNLHVVAGTAEQVTAELQDFLKLGVTHFLFRMADFPRMDGYERLVGEVLPRLGVTQ